ncbi:MAG: hypothetical protein GY784_13860 [Gammaproteobacteria bacterium]|nr:hypothetical protein [Gammaproteobacteria bacterium]
MEEEEELESESGEASGGSKKKLTLIIVAVIALLGAIVGGTLQFVGTGANPDAAAELESEQEEEEEEEEEDMVDMGDPIYVDLEPAFTVNLDPNDKVGFLQVSLQVLTYDDDVAADLNKHKPLIRNNLLYLFGQQKSIDLRTPEGKLNLQQSTLETVQNAISQYGGGGEVDSVFFTAFVMQ